MFEIVKGLPIPEKKSLRNWKRHNKYPFGQMEVGDCIKFSAAGLKDPEYKKIYGSATSFARRVNDGTKFRFAEIEPGVYGCWKINAESKNSAGGQSETSRVRKRADTSIITKDMLIAALESQGTLLGASRSLGVSSRTLTRLKQKFELI